MREVRGEHRLPPKAVSDAVVTLARQLGRSLAGDDLFLVAIAGLEGDPPARRALGLEGLTAERLLAKVRADGDRPAGEPSGSLHYAPAYYSVVGRAVGFAACLGDGRVQPEHLLVALVWDPMSQSSQLLWRLGVARERILEQLSELGVPVPQAPLPRQYEVEMGDKVWFDRDQTARVLDHVRLHLPPGTQWGFNYEANRAWVVAESDVDVEALVRAALTA